MENKVLKSYRALSLLKIAREGIEGEEDEGEGKFGLVPPSVDPNNALSNPIHSGTKEGLEGPRAHPLLGKSAQFTGIDSSLTADPQANKDAKEQYPQLRMQQQLKKRQNQRHSPRLTK